MVGASAPPGEGRRRLVERLHRAWAGHPRLSLAGRGAIAATVAWFAGTLAPAPLSDYPYYAPLGAVIATTSTVVRSVRDSIQSVAAVLLGAVIARGVALTPLPGPIDIAVVVGLALLCVGWRVFGELGEWVVVSAVFVLLLGSGDPFEYISAYAGLIIVGAAIGIGFNLLLPPLPLTPSDRALDRLRDALVEQLESLADWLEHQGPLEVEEWERRRHTMVPVIEAARLAVARSEEAQRGNRRFRRYRSWAARQTERARALGTCAEAVDEIVRLLVDWEGDHREELALGRGLRPVCAATLRDFAAALGTDDDPPDLRLAESTDRLGTAVRRAQRSTDQDLFVAGALIVTLRRAADALRPAER